jgi:beta-N-acetylglucosaminidase
MKKIFKTLLFTLLIAFALSNKVLAEESYKEFPNKTNVSQNKIWTVNFNIAFDPSTINEENVKVIDSDNNVVSAAIQTGNLNSSIIVNIPAGGYTPGKTYYLILNTKIKSHKGNNLAKPVKMKFDIAKNYTIGSNYEILPKINSCSIENTDISQNKNLEINLTAKDWDKVQYRVFIHKYEYGNDSYEEITNGYTNSTYANTPYKIVSSKKLPSGTNGQKYKLLIFVKKADSTGTYRTNVNDTVKNMDYDNYYVDYFRILPKVDNSNTEVKNYSNTLNKVTEIQSKISSSAVTDEAPGSWTTANENQIKYYLNYKNFMDPYGKFMFLKLNYMEGITKEDLNSILKGKGILEGHGETFLKASKENNINPIYLVSHCLLETGNGTSKLAKGIEVNKIDGKEVEIKTVFNLFGIKAYDNDPIKYGSLHAYEQDWTSIDKAIEGGAKYISENYINSYYKQDTLYKMRWNPEKPGTHQYATDIAWPFKQILNIKPYFDKCQNAKPVFEIPSFN